MAHFSEGWLYRATITVTPPSLSGALSNYPMLVRLTPDNFDFDNAKADGSDVRFALTTGSAFLPHELVSWEGGSNSLGVFYVLLPSLPVAGMSLYVYSGMSTATDVSAPSTVWAEYEAVVHMIRDESGDIYESKSGLPLELVAESSDSYPQTTEGKNHKAEYFDGDQGTTYWKLPDGLIPDLSPSASTNPGTVSLEVVTRPYVWEPRNRPIVSQGTNSDYSLYLKRYGDSVYFHDGPSPYLEMDSWGAITAVRGESTQDAYCNGNSESGSGNIHDCADPSVCIGGHSAVTTDGTERAYKGLIEEVRIVFAERSEEWHSVLYKDLILSTLNALGEWGSNPNAFPPTGTDEEGPTDSLATVVDASAPNILSATVSLEPFGISQASLQTTYEISAGDYVVLEDSVTEVDVFKGIVSKCVQDKRTNTYRIQLMDPINALSQGKVLFSETNPVSVLNEVAIDYGQAVYGVVGSSAKLAPIEVGEAIDPENEIESDPADWVDLVRTVERIVTSPFTYRSNGQYRLDGLTDRGTLTDSQLLDAIVAVDQNRYANRIICKCSGEWWEDPGEETTGTEWIRGANMTVTRYGDQIRKIEITTADLDYEENFTYDEDNRLIKHEVITVRELSSFKDIKTIVTREWDITDEATYTYTESTVTQHRFEEGEFVNELKTEREVEVVEGAVTETVQEYGWNFELEDWHVLVNDDGADSGISTRQGDGSRRVTYGFTAQPGLGEYAIIYIYKYYWTDEFAGEYDMELQRTEITNSCPSAPGWSTILPLYKHSVNYCVTADDEDAQEALGLKEKIYQPLCVQDDSALTTLKTIAENALIWHCRCRKLTTEVALSLAETWLPGDTFTWNGLLWTIEELEHNLKSRRTGIVATSEASIAALKKALLPELDELGFSIKGIARKEAEKFDNVEYITIVRQIDYETYVVQMSDGTKKIAHLEFGADVLLAPGTSMVVLRESLS